MAVVPEKIYEGLPFLFGSFFISKDKEERRKCAVLLCTILLFLLYNSFLIFSVLFYEGPFFTFLRSAALTYVVVEISLVILLYYTQNLYLVTALFLIDIDLGTVVICFNFGLVSEYMLWLLFIPTLLFYIMGATAGLRSLIFIIIQISVFVFLSCYVIPPSEELVLLPPIHKWFVVLMSYLIVGTTAFVHESSREQAINKLKGAIKEREEAHDQLQEATLAKSQFMANISHELRTPLHGIIASTSMLLEAIPPMSAIYETTRDNAEIIRDCSEHMLALINNILDIERIETKRLQLESIVFKPAQELESLLKVFAVQAEQRKIQLRKAIDVRHATRIGDPLRLKQVLFNLVSNALKFSSEGGVVTVRMSDESEELRVEVEDDGIGIKEEHRTQLFKAFSQVDSSITRRYGGSGLGLAISQRLCQSMGGEIHCTSAYGQGSKFWFVVTLPIHSAEMESFLLLEDSCDQTVPPCTPSADLPSRKVLFVEDNIINQKVGVRMLRSFGCQIRVANNGLECIQAWEEEDFDAILMDCQMPIMDGFDATRKIREWESVRAGLLVNAIESGQVVPDAAARRHIGPEDEHIVTPHHPRHLVADDGDGKSQKGQRDGANGERAHPPTSTAHEREQQQQQDSNHHHDHPQHHGHGQPRVLGDPSEQPAPASEGGHKSNRRSARDTSSTSSSSGEDTASENTRDGEDGDKHGSTPDSQRPWRTPIIALTASATLEYRRKCMDSGMDDWLPKPFDKTKLCHILNRWLAADGEDSCCSCSDCSGSECSLPSSPSVE